MRWVATSIGCAGILCLNVVWMFIFSMSPVGLLVWTQRLYILNLFLFGMAGAHWFGRRMWFMLIGTFLFSCCLSIGNAGISSVLLVITALKDSLLIVTCMLFGASVYFILFQKINMNR